MTIGSVDVRDGLYQLIPVHLQPHSINSTIIHPKCNVIPIDLWHFRLGHLSSERMHIMQQQYSCLNNNKNFVCNTCHYAKQRKLPFPLSNSHATQPFALIHMDIWGPYSTLSMNGHRYFLTIVDDHTRYTWVYLMCNKSETRTHITNFINLVENQFDTHVKIICTDNGNEFFMHELFHLKGIIHQTSCIETPQQNGIVERKHQHLLNVTRALLFHSNLPDCFWSFALLHATYLINCIPTPFLKNTSPFEKLHGVQCDIAMIKVFGCLCYITTITSQRKKLDPRAHPCIFSRFPFSYQRLPYL
uniref:Retrovirus-related Pol polyprotein from transposon TNT 1-94 n=1 Tax=Cajanus cajan TaxID=3821 RepID=A0A151T6Z7_CAJCA|nr:Retrovirus-related Pol polyprotein from transposon TNT 1-94 [Cajanus cajan]